MAEQITPSNVALPAAHRSFTSPARLTATDFARRGSTSTSPSVQDSQIDTLFAHPSARIVQFSTATPSDFRTRTAGNRHAEQASASESLPWTSSLERTIAVGTLRICKSRSGVTILNCGHAMQPILPKSKCWCVDERSGKFVLQMRKPQYWRIELPTADKDDIELIDRFRGVLDDVLQFEKTICPFARDFSVDLPESSRGAITYRPWKPRDVPEKATHSMKTSSMTRAHGGQIDLRDAEGSTLPQALVVEDGLSGATGTEQLYADEPDVVDKRTVSLSDLANTSAMWSSVSDSKTDLPPLPQPRLHPPPAAAADVLPTRPRSTSVESDVSDAASSHESFQTVASWQSPGAALPPSPPLSNPTSPTRMPFPPAGFKTPVRTLANHGDAKSSDTWRRPPTWHAVEPEPRSDWSLKENSFERSPSGKSSGSVILESTDGNTATGQESQAVDASPLASQRLGCSSKSLRVIDDDRPLQRAPPPFSPTRSIASPSTHKPRRLRTARHIPTAILQKTYEILLSPPSHLIGIMLELARTVRSGEWRGWIWNGDDEAGSCRNSANDHEEFMNDDDYEVALPSNSNDRRRGLHRRTSNDDRWEVD